MLAERQALRSGGAFCFNAFYPFAVLEIVGEPCEVYIWGTEVWDGECITGQVTDALVPLTSLAAGILGRQWPGDPSECEVLRMALKYPDRPALSAPFRPFRDY
jgi:hypothetical protein